MIELKKHVETLIARAANAPRSEEAMRFSQAALNAANAMCSLKTFRWDPAPTPTQTPEEAQQTDSALQSQE